MKKSFLIYFLLSLPALSGCPAQQSGNGKSPGGEQIETLQRIIDGDTIVLMNGEHVRYIGVNAPEISHGEKPGEFYGPEATECNRSILGGGRGVKLKLVYDKRLRDKYGRLLAYIYTGTDFKTFVNAELLKQGCAETMNIPPDSTHADEFSGLEKKAEDSGTGMWARRH